MIQWQYYPRSEAPTKTALDVVAAFDAAEGIDSNEQDDPSNAILASVASGLVAAGFAVETGKKAEEKIKGLY